MADIDNIRLIVRQRLLTGMTFLTGDIIGQEQIKEHLQNAISAKKISHAYIINGEKSSGKDILCYVCTLLMICFYRTSFWPFAQIKFYMIK